MKPSYRDILAVADGTPVEWWDAEGVPRFWPFEPRLLGVYDQLAVLAEIACQSCGTRFLVGLGRPRIKLYPGASEFDRRGGVPTPLGVGLEPLER